MKVLTVNLPESHLVAIQRLIGELYPSRSEVIRCAVRDLLREYIEIIKKETKAQLIEDDFPVDDDGVVRIPIIDDNDKVIGYRTVDVVRRLE